MKDCVDPEGHMWRAVWGAKARRDGLVSTMVTCQVEGCDEIGYVIEEVAQKSGQQ
jgi:hypothetical protein